MPQQPQFNNQGCQCRDAIRRINERVDNLERQLRRLERRVSNLENSNNSIFSRPMPAATNTSSDDESYSNSNNYMI